MDAPEGTFTLSREQWEALQHLLNKLPVPPARQECACLGGIHVEDLPTYVVWLLYIF
jgi:hypothetical protein